MKTQKKRTQKQDPRAEAKRLQEFRQLFRDEPKISLSREKYLSNTIIDRDEFRDFLNRAILSEEQMLEGVVKEERKAMIKKQDDLWKKIYLSKDMEERRDLMDKAKILSDRLTDLYKRSCAFHCAKLFLCHLDISKVLAKNRDVLMDFKFVTSN